jgi:hypothetical protein
MTNTGPTDPLAQARAAVADATTDCLEKIADAAEIERKFPAMSSLPKPLEMAPDVINDFLQSDAYKQAVEDYIEGRTNQTLLITALQMLRDLLPSLFGGI